MIPDLEVKAREILNQRDQGKITHNLIASAFKAKWSCSMTAKEVNLLAAVLNGYSVDTDLHLANGLVALAKAGVLRSFKQGGVTRYEINLTQVGF